MTVTTYQRTTGAVPGEQARLAVVLEIPDGWHVNANKPLDEYLIPTEAALEPPEGFGVEGMAYPEAILASFSFSDEKLAVYEHTAAVGIVVSVAETVAPGKYEIPGTVRYQACNDTVCAPPKTVSFTAQLTVVSPGAEVSEQHTDIFEDIDFEQPPAAEPPQPLDETLAGPPAEDLQTGGWRELADNFTVTGRNSGYMGSEAFVEWIVGVEAGTVDSGLNAFAGKSALAIILLTFLGGLALNLTPCVLPLIPINLAIIGAGARFTRYSAWA